MYRVMIVDDEKYVRKSIINRINWKKYGLEVIGEADNGRDAYELVGVIRPDIMIVDVKMPLMNGIELIRKVKEEFSDIFFIILSGYDDFEYTKEAIKLGIANYIKKPVDEKELESTLLLIIDSLKRRHANDEKLDHMSKQIEYSTVVLKSKYLNSLINGSGNSNEELLVFQHDFFALLLVHLSQTQQGADPYELMKNFIEPNINKAMEDVYKRAVKCYVFANESYPQEIRILVNDSNITSDLLIRTAELFINYLSMDFNRFYPGYYVSVSISPVCKALGKIPDIYEKALKALKCRVFCGRRDLYTYIHNEQKDSVFTEYVYNYLTKIYTAIEARNFLEMDHLLSKVFNEQNTGKFSVDLLEGIVLEFVNILNRIIIKYNINAPDLHVNEFFQPYYLLKFKDLKELKENISCSVKELFSRSLNFEEGNMVNKIKQYIENNYKSELSLPQIAKEFYVNPSYLSQLFKSKTGKNISKYIEEIRIEKAKELLISLNVSVFDVAFHVGYNDANYFSKVFKRKTGFAPSKYHGDFMKEHLANEVFTTKK